MTLIDFMTFLDEFEKINRSDLKQLVQKGCLIPINDKNFPYIALLYPSFFKEMTLIETLYQFNQNGRELLNTALLFLKDHEQTLKQLGDAFPLIKQNCMKALSDIITMTLLFEPGIINFGAGATLYFQWIWILADINYNLGIIAEGSKKNEK
jgi:hypothetical protein